MYVLAITVMPPSLLVGHGEEVRHGSQTWEGKRTWQLASSTVPCHATQYSRPEKLKKSPPSLLLSRRSLEQRPGLKPMAQLCSEGEAPSACGRSVICESVNRHGSQTFTVV